MSNPSDYYLRRRPRLLKEFDTYVGYAHPVLVRYFGEANVASLVGETRRNYEGLIPQLPYLGGKQPFTQFVTATGLYLAVYRVASERGKSLEETGELLYEIGRGLLRAYPVIMARFFGKMNFSRLYLNRLRRRARESHSRKYNGDYVFDFVPGDGETFDYGVDYLECGSCKFLAQQGAPELAPYICPVDILYSEALGWGLTRTRTLAEGAEKCDFRFKKDGPTRVAVPVSLRAVVERGR